MQDKESNLGLNKKNSFIKPTSDDFHHWSIYRQALNATLSQNVLSQTSNQNYLDENYINKNLNFLFKPGTVEKILSSNNSLTYNYINYGLPRVQNPIIQNKLEINKSIQNEIKLKKTFHTTKYKSNSNQNLKHWNSNPDFLDDKLDAKDKISHLKNHKINSKKKFQRSNSFVDFQHLDRLLNNFSSNSLNKLDKTSNRIKLKNSNKLLQKSNLSTNSNLFKYKNEKIKLSNCKDCLSSESESQNINTIKSMNSIQTVQQNVHLVINQLYHEFDSTSNLNLLCGGARQKIRVLDGISFEAKAGEMLALIATNELESSTIFDILMNQHSKSRTRTITDFYLNSNNITPCKLSKLCAYVGPNIELCENMSARQTILFFNLLQQTKQKNSNAKNQIDALMEELGLSEVKHTSVANLSKSEKVRIMIAIALMLDTKIILIDQPIKSMDIFDSLFVLNYIHQYCLLSGKIAIIALQPPTNEIFSLFNRIALISTGRIVYFGDKNKFTSYFSFADYPCPLYKNPADYYLDLVTVDHLSSTSIIESNQRIESLVQLYKKKTINRKTKTGSRGTLPTEINQKSFAIDFLAIWIRAMIFCFPYNIINFGKRLLLAVCLSLICGCIFFKMRLGREQEDVWDRFGFYHTLLAIFCIPIFLSEIKNLHEQKPHILEELRLKLYFKEAYLCSYFIYTFPSSSIIFLGYIFPASSIVVQKQDILFYILLMLSYFHIIRLLAIITSWMLSSKLKSSLAFGLIYYILIYISNCMIHVKNLNLISRFVIRFSIYTWTYQSLIYWEFENSKNVINSKNLFHLNKKDFLCSNNPLVQHENAIVAPATCGIQKRSDILQYFLFKNYFSNWFQPLTIYLIWFISLLFVWYCVLCVLCSNNSNLLKANNRRKKLPKKVKDNIQE